MTGQEQRIKISDLPSSVSFRGLWTVGYQNIDGKKTSVKVSLDEIRTAYDNVVSATTEARQATEAAQTATQEAGTARDAANTAAGNADRATTEAGTARDEANAAAGRVDTAITEAGKATEAANRATADTRQAITDAETATRAALDAEEGANTARDAANTAAGKANRAATDADTATTAARTATEEANTARDDANTAAGKANKAAADADTATTAVRTATEEANTARDAANTAAGKANKAAADADTATTAVRTATEEANTARDAANKAAGKADTATANARTATTEANTATALINELSAHPTKPQAGLWYRWNTETDAYENTGIQAKGDPGQSFRIIGQYDTIEDLKAAVPDGTGIDGVYAVGSADPFNYYAWIYRDGAWQWVDQGQLRGAEGKSAYEVWMEDPDNAGKTEADYFAYLRQPATEAAAETRQAIAGAEQATQDAQAATDKANTVAGEANAARDAANTAAGKANKAAADADTATTAARTATEAANTAALAANSAAASIFTPDIDHVPGETDLTYTAEGKTYDFHPGDECRYFDPDLQEYVFYKLHDITDEGKALWQEAGSGGRFKGEEVAVHILSDQGNPDSGLYGLLLTARVGIETEYLAYAGQPMALNVEKGKECTITPPAKEGYITPEPVTFTAEASGTREITFRYYAVSYLVFDASDETPANITLAEPALFNRLEAEARRRHLMKRTPYGWKAARLADGNTTLYSDATQAALDGSEGDVMTCLPDLYVKVQQESGGIRSRVAVCLSNADGTMHLLRGGWAGCYKASLDGGGKLRSISGVEPVKGLSLSELREAAALHGQGYGEIDYGIHCLIALFLYGKYDTRDLQGTLGAGGACHDANNTTGSSNPLGNADTRNETAGYVSGLGLEGVFGGLYEHLDGVYKLDDGWHVLEADGSERLVPAPDLKNGWIRRMAFETSDRFDLLPVETGASGTTCYTDFYEGVASRFLPMYASRSCFTSSIEEWQDDGIAYLNTFNTESTSSEFYGGRLLFRGEVEVVDPSTFKGLENLDTIV